jgi:hypothetical protein
VNFPIEIRYGTLISLINADKRFYTAVVIASAFCEAISGPSADLAIYARDCFVAKDAPRNDSYVGTTKASIQRSSESGL